VTTTTHGLTDYRIGRTVKALALLRGVTLDEVAATVGISRGGLFSKVKGQTKFAAWEVQALADYFGRPVGDLYDGNVGYVDTTPSDAGITNSGTDKNLKWLTPLRSHVPTLLRTIAPFLPAEVPRAA